MAIQKSVWDTILKVVIAVASAILGAIGGNVTGVLNLPPATGWEERQQEKVVKHLLKAEAGRRCFRFIRQDGNKTVVKTPAGPLSFHGNGIPLYRKPVISE